MKNTLFSRFSFLGVSNIFNKLKALGVVFFLLISTIASATHYRYGTISWKRVSPGCSIEVTVKQAWRTSFFFGGTPSVGDTAFFTTLLHLRSSGGASLGTVPIDIAITSVNAPDDWFFGEFKTTFLLASCDSSYLLTYDSGDRISTLVNNADALFGSVSKVTPHSSGNDSPVSSQTPIVKLATGLAAPMFPLSGVDPNGDPLTFRVALPSEAGGDPDEGSSHPDFIVAPGGTATFSTIGKAVGGQYNVWYAVEDSKGALVLGDFLIEIVAASPSVPPVFDFGVTPSPAPCIKAKPGDLVTFTVKADDPDAADSVFLSAVGVPLTASHFPTIPTSPHKPDMTTFSWTPGPGDIGTTVVTYTAEDDGGLQTSTAICIEVSADTGCVAPGSLTLHSDTSWRKSTVITPSNLSGVWAGVGGTLPADASFTLPAILGQPYSFHSIDSVDGSRVIKTGRDITYFRKYFTIGGDDDVAARIRMNVDDHVEVYVNGFLVVAKYSGSAPNFKNPPLDADLQADGTIINPNGGGDAYSTVTFSELDDIFVAGVNSLTLAVRNYGKSSDKGGFSFRMDLDYKIKSANCDVLDSCVSDTSWDKSTVVTPSNFSGFWGGVASLPATATYTLPAVAGQPYGFHTIDSVPGAVTIKTGNNITYFRKEFTMLDNIGVDSRFRMTVDDGMEIYINGQLIAREENIPVANRKVPGHDLNFVAGGPVFVNGFAGGDPFDFVTTVDLDTIFVVGVNEVVLVVRNFAKAGDKGGFSFRMDLTKGGTSVVKKSEDYVAPEIFAEVALPVQLYPNPTSNFVNLIIKEDVGVINGEVAIMDLNGRILQQRSFDTQEIQISLDGYTSGIYLVRINAGGKTHTSKVLKQ